MAVVNPAVCCHYFPPSPRIRSQLQGIAAFCSVPNCLFCLVTDFTREWTICWELLHQRGTAASWICDSWSRHKFDALTITPTRFTVCSRLKRRFSLWFEKKYVLLVIFDQVQFIVLTVMRDSRDQFNVCDANLWAMMQNLHTYITRWSIVLCPQTDFLG